MKARFSDAFPLTLVSLSLFVANHAANAFSEPHQTVYPLKNQTTICQEDFMSVYISKEEFAYLPFAIYVQDKQGSYHEAMAIAKHCNYFIWETHSFVVLTVTFRSCFVTRQKYTTTLTAVVVEFADEGRVHIIKPVHLICRTATREEMNHGRLPTPKRSTELCSEDGFNVVVERNATAPPLDLDAVWIPSGRGQTCQPKATSPHMVVFTFPFTACGTQSVEANRTVTYWINIDEKRVPQGGSISHRAPYRLTVACSFALTNTSKLDWKIWEQRSDRLPTLKSEGRLRVELRFAKDSSYRSFYSFRNPVVAELAQPVYVEVYVLKSEDKNLVLLLEDCWATPSEDPDHPLRWKLLVKGCPFSGDSHGTVVLPVSGEEVMNPALHKRFVVKLFTFVKPPGLQSLVYFHCNVEICKGEHCSQQCTNSEWEGGDWDIEQKEAEKCCTVLSQVDL